MKKATHENFVAIYDNYFSEKMCDDLVAHFDWCQRSNKTYARGEAEKFKKDDSTNLNPTAPQEIEYAHPNVSGFIGEFNTVFWDECYKDYLDTYSTLSDYDQHTIYSYKLQKTQPSGGYHIWHCEDGSKLFSRRVGVYILYLNDVEEGGETEFLYFSKRVAPKKGRLVIFPPNFPWTHRGNPPLSGTKYIMTGWTEYT